MNGNGNRIDDNFLESGGVRFVVEFLMIPKFEGGELHSQSRIPAIASEVRQAMLDDDFPREICNRKSLMLMIAKLSLATWQESCHRISTS